MEKKLDLLMEKIDLLYKSIVKDDFTPRVDSPLNQAQQVCPLCKQLIKFYLAPDHTIDRECGCKPPIV